MGVDAGIKPEDERLAGDLAKLEARVMAELWHLPGVTAALTDKLGLGCGRGDVAAMVAHALVHYRTGEEIVVAFNAVDEALKDNAARVRERRGR